MRDFDWTSPTRFVFGRGAEEKIGPWARESKLERAVVIYGRGHVLRDGLLDRVTSSLDDAGIAHVELGGVRPNPEVNKVREGVALAKESGADLIVAVGGGSVIDTAKATAAGALYEGDVWDFYRRPDPVRPTGALPIAAVPTIPAAGSESSDSTVIQNDETRTKCSFHADFVRPRVAFMNPELTMSLPAWQTFSGICDMCAHIFERFFSASGDVPVTDGISLSVLRSIRTEAIRLRRDPSNYDARASIMWASTLAHNGLCGLGRTEDWASHALEHELSAAHPEITHGAGLAVVFPAWMRHVYEEKPNRFALLGKEMFGLVPTGNEKADALAAIDLVQDFFVSLGMPRYLDEFGLTPGDVDDLVESLVRTKGESFGNFKRLGAADARSIYLSAFEPHD
ncbi:MAG: iron-containing alcohol dehydrogenase [Olsenella sp.]|nr:iron-containing alcohol dehydrogenase [Olsenella sp.]